MLLPNCLPPSPKQCRGTGMGAVISLEDVVSDTYKEPWNLLLQLGVLYTEDSILQLLQCESFPWATRNSLPQIFPEWILPVGCSSSLTAPAWVRSTECYPLWTDYSNMRLCATDHKLWQQTYSYESSSLHRVRGPGRSLLQHGLSTRSQNLLSIHLLCHGVLCSWHTDLYIPVDPMGSRDRAAAALAAPQAAGESDLQCLEYLLPLLLYWPGCLQNCSSLTFSLLSPSCCWVLIFSAI